MPTGGPIRKCIEDDVSDGQKRAALRVKQRQRELSHQPRIDGKVPARRRAGTARSRPAIQRPPWDDRACTASLGRQGSGHSRTGLVAANARSATSTRGRSSNRIRTKELVEKADGEAIVMFQQSAIVCKNSSFSGSELTSTASSSIDMRKIREALLDVCNDSPQHKASSATPTAILPTRHSSSPREEATLDRLERHLLGLETAEDILRHSLGDFVQRSDGGPIVDANTRSNEHNEEDTDGLPNVEPNVTSNGTSIHPNQTDISLDTDIEEKFNRHAKAYKYRRRRIEEPLARSGVSPVEVVEM